MYIKRVFALVIATATLATAVSCSSATNSQVSGASNDALKSGNSKELTMYIMDYDTVAKNAVEKFNETHKGAQIKVKNFAVTYSEEFQSKLMYGLNNDQGPDIILCEQSALPNLSVFFDKGSFYDLNTLIKNDKYFKQSDYFEKVLEYGMYNEKRYVIPLSFKIDSLYTTKKILDKSGQGITDRGAGIDEFIAASKKHTAAGDENSEYFVSNVSFGNLLQSSKVPFFDLGNKTTNFNSKDFGDLMDKYKSLSEITCPDIMVASPVECNNLLSSNKAVFASIQTMGLRYSADPYGSFKSEVEPVIIPAPYADTTRHIIAMPEKYIGINCKCGNVNAAYDFIKLMLSKDFQDIDIMEGIPINCEAYEQEKDNCLKGMVGYNTWKKGGCKNADTLKRLYSQLDQLVNNVDRCWTTDDYLLTIVQDEVDNYIKSNSTKENTLKAIQEKVEGYLKSGIMTAPLYKEDDTPTDPSKTLSLYYWNSQNYVSNTEHVFKEKYPDIKIKRKTINSIKDFYTTVPVEMMAGGGPDIVIFEPSYFNSISKTVETGVFCEMDEYLKKYNILNFEEYNIKLLDSGVFNGKRYYIPLYYYYSPILSTKKLLEKNNINIDEENWTWERLAQFSKSFMNANKGENVYFFNNSFNLSSIIKNCEIPLVDYVNKKSNFNSDTFKQILQLYRMIYPSVDPQGGYFKDIAKNERDVFISGSGMGEPLYFRMHYDDVVNYSGSEMVVVPTPTLNGIRREYVMPKQCIAVNSRCKNKDAAFMFVKIAASSDIQQNYDSRGQANGILALPVNSKAYRDDMLTYESSGAIPELIVNQMIQTHSIIEPGLIKDYNILDMAEELAKDYIEGNKTADQVAKEMDEKVNVFLNE